MNNKFLLSLILGIFIISFISAKDPFVLTDGTSGCEIAPITRDVIKLNQDFDFNFHVFNLSNGYPLSNSTVTCNLHLYNQTGDHIFGANILNDPISEHGVANEFVYRAPASVFNYKGEGAYLVQCNGTAAVGGCVTKGTYLITYGGIQPLTGSTLIFFILIFILAVAGFTYLVVYSLGRVVELNFDIIDLAVNYSAYFAFVIFYYFTKIYYPDNFVITLSEWIINLGAFIFIFLATIYFILTLTIGSWMNRRVKGVDF